MANVYDKQVGLARFPRLHVDWIFFHDSASARKKAPSFEVWCQASGSCGMYVIAQEC